MDESQNRVMSAHAAAAANGPVSAQLTAPRPVTDPRADCPETPAQWRTFYEENWRWIYQVVRRVGGHDIEVEDAVQDVFVVLANKLHTFEGRSQLRTWVYRICLNVTSEHRRRRQRQRRIEHAASMVAFWREGPQTSERILEARGDAALVQQILAKMGERKREVFVLREVEQLSGDDVAEVLGIPSATVRTRLFHARKEFTRLLEKNRSAQKSVREYGDPG